MVQLVTLDAVKKSLRVDFDDDDDSLGVYIEAASEAIINYLDERADAVLDLDSGGEIPSGVEVPSVVQLAATYLTGYFYRNTDSDPDKVFAGGYLPPVVVSLLYPLRDPALS